jgi:hypothetical protein
VFSPNGRIGVGQYGDEGLGKAAEDCGRVDRGVFAGQLQCERHDEEAVFEERDAQCLQSFAHDQLLLEEFEIEEKQEVEEGTRTEGDRLHAHKANSAGLD